MNTQHIDLIEDLPLLTETVDDDAPRDLPILTEIIPELAADEFQAPVVHEVNVAEPYLPPTLSPAEIQQLLHHLETHLETVFTSKLNAQMEQLQKLAIDLAVSEFKAELPKLLHDALKNRL